MLNKLARKRMTIVVGKRKPTLADEVDAMVTISVTKTDDPQYLEMRMPKPRGQTSTTQVYDVSPFAYTPPYEPPPPPTNPAADWSDLD